MKRPGGRWLAAALAVAVGLLLWRGTEWVEVETPLPPQGPARDNPLYSVQQLAARLGAKVELRHEFDRLPPPGATLLLTSSHWNLVPERERALRQWVEQGGHLVMPSHRTLSRTSWIPLRHEFDAKDFGAGQQVSLRNHKPGQPLPRKCRDLQEPAEVMSPAYPGRSLLRACGIYGNHITAGVRPIWQLRSTAGAVAVTVPVGQGHVSQYADAVLMDNRGLLEADHALITMALLRPGPGRTIWLLPHERRDPLPAWLWAEARPVLLLAAAALLLWLWRRAPRFGPPLAPLERARRSVADQVRGHARFLWRHQPQALLDAQRQALAETAARHGAPSPPATGGQVTRQSLPTRLRALELERRRLADHAARRRPPPHPARPRTLR